MYKPDKITGRRNFRVQEIPTHFWKRLKGLKKKLLKGEVKMRKSWSKIHTEMAVEEYPDNLVYVNKIFISSIENIQINDLKKSDIVFRNWEVLRRYITWQILF